MKFDPRLLQYLLAIDTHGTFIRAAEAEGISQPALSNKISLLERHFGMTLIDRGRHGARLNAQGKLLLRHARAISAVVDRAEAEIEEEKRGDSGPLVIAGTPISMVELVPRALAKLDALNRRVRISLIEADDDVLLDLLRAGEIDLMLGGTGADQQDDDILEEYLIDFPLQAVVGRDNPLWGREAVSIEEIISQDWALPAAGSVIRSYVDAIFVGAGSATPTSYWSCSSMHGLKAVIQHTRRVSLMPVHAISLEAEKGVLKGLRLLNPSSSRKLNILRQRHMPLSLLAETFCDHLFNVAEEVQSQRSAHKRP